jgi:D-alanyl-D-alanine carboxypeptidase
MLRMGVAAAALAMTADTAGATASAASPRVRSGSAPSPDALQRALDQLAGNGAAGVLAEVRDAAWTWRGSAGVAELGTSRPVPAGGRFRMGSVTKTFVATVMLQLVAERRVRLHDTVQRWLPGLLPGGDRITLRHLLQHTSGLVNYNDRYYELYPTTADLLRVRDRFWSPHELLALTEGQPALFEPGTAWAYSNTNYIVAGLVIEQVTGDRYATEISRRILDPLGLRRTLLPGDDPRIPGPHSHGYLPADQTGEPVDVSRFNPSIAWAAGEMVSTTADLNRFFDALLGGRLLPPALLAEMKTVFSGEDQFGLGLLRLLLPGVQPLWGFTGGIFGYTTVAASTEDGRRQIAVSLTPWGDNESFDALVNLLAIAFPAPAAPAGTPRRETASRALALDHPA